MSAAAVMIDEISAEQYMQTVEGLAIGKVPVEIDPEEGGNAVAVMKQHRSAGLGERAHRGI